MPEQDFKILPEGEPQWRLTLGISREILLKAISQAVSITPDLPEWLPEKLINKYSYPNFKTAIKNLHLGSETQSNIARARLAYDELLAHQLTLNIAKKNWVKKESPNHKKNDRQKTESILKLFHKNLPFKPTADQIQAVKEIQSDIESSQRMLRLLQGDVGSGKTYVAACAIIYAIANNAQAAIMAPTDLLARQHLHSLNKWFDSLNIKIVLLAASITKSEKKQAIDSIASGQAKVIIGTHALFQQNIIYQKLNLVVIDEQHKFGVLQRVAMAEKAKSLNILAMSATPIPRTLMLAVWGGINCSRIQSMPFAKKNIITKIIDSNRIDEVILAIKRWREKDEKIYWVCPHINNNSENYIASVQQRTKYLISKFSEQNVIPLHAKIPSLEREKALQKFSESKNSILVATTMIEVGIDITNARVIVIENAELFGLAQLHQLRGRVGRDGKQAKCLLLYDKNATSIAKERLNILRETQDGFVIAEHDWRLRGSGDTIGYRQSGLPQFLFADLKIHNNLAQNAAQHAEKLINQISQINDTQKKTLRILMTIFKNNNNSQTIEAT